MRGSPVSIPVSVPPDKRGVPTKVITGLNGPWGVAVTIEGQVIIIEYNVHSDNSIQHERKENKVWIERYG